METLKYFSIKKTKLKPHMENTKKKKKGKKRRRQTQKQTQKQNCFVLLKNAGKS